MMFGLLVSISGLLVLFNQELREERTLWPKQEELSRNIEHVFKKLEQLVMTMKHRS
jgi:hypothetical protein